MVPEIFLQLFGRYVVSGRFLFQGAANITEPMIATSNNTLAISNGRDA